MGDIAVLNLSYAETKDRIRTKLNDIRFSFVEIGYYLKWIRDQELYLTDGYADLYECAYAEFGIRKATVNHCIRINTAFSEGGNSLETAGKYREFSKSQLQELLYLPEDVREEITPDMTVKEIRKAGKKKKDPGSTSSRTETVDQEEKAGQTEKTDPGKTGEPLSYFGFPKTVRPEGSLMTTPGCGNGKYDCFTCSRQCQIRQEPRRCRAAVNEESCQQMGSEVLAESPVKERCMFVNVKLAPVRIGDQEPSPCCLECLVEDCPVRCSVSRADGQEDTADGNKEIKEHSGSTSSRSETKTSCPPGQSDCRRQEWGASPEEQRAGQKECAKCWETYRKRNPVKVAEKEELEQVLPLPDSDSTSSQEVDQVSDVRERQETETDGLITPENLLKEMQEDLKEYLKVFDDHSLPFVVKQQILVRALELLVESRKGEAEIPEDLETVETEAEELPVQPELPCLKNNNDRKEWLRNYKDWGLWYEDQHTGVRYYKYDFENGARLIAEVYVLPKTKYHEEKEECFLHLVGGPVVKKKGYVQRWTHHETYDHYANSESELVEFLKELQKAEKNCPYKKPVRKEK